MSIPRNLALCYQESLVVIVRVRSGRQKPATADLFREQMRRSLELAEEKARGQGYAGEDARRATFAVIAFLDESVLNSGEAVFSGWARKPLQEEYFGQHVAGELFFESLDRLMGRDDSDELADILEVYNTCLLLGYGGRYGDRKRADLQVLVDRVSQRIERIRSRSRRPPPAPAAVPAAPVDPWIGRLRLAVFVFAPMAVVLWLAYTLLLRSKAGELQQLVDTLVQ
ncbi:MAG: DotU family type IV/VI secretion system protein [bacterium]|nr:DotU family type IV/VI secretion system protein [bacterium]